MAPPLPSFAPFPESPAWRELLEPTEWAAYLESWLSLARAHLALADAEFAARSVTDESLVSFVRSCTHGSAVQGPAALGESPAAESLKKSCYLLAARILRSAPNPECHLLQWEFVSDFSRVYGRRRAGQALAKLPAPGSDLLDASLLGLKKFLVKSLDGGLHAGLSDVEERLKRVNFVISAWPPAAALFLAGSDYFDGLVGCFRITNPPLRKCIVTNLYLCLVGLTEGVAPKMSLLTDVLYSLRSAAEEHKKGPLNANKSLVAELVTATPVLQQLEHRADAAGLSTGRIAHALRDLEQYRKPGPLPLPSRLTKTAKGKGKALVVDYAEDVPQRLHAHQWSQISQIQDLFPDLGSGFVAKLLDEYNDDSEQVIAHLLEGTLPKHLETADRAENLQSNLAPGGQHAHIAPKPAPPQPTPRRHVHNEDDDVHRLAAETSKMHFGKQKSSRTVDDVLRDRSTAPRKAAILSALAAFDADDDERDDTYDAVDVGGTVDDAGGDRDDLENAKEALLFAAYQASPQAFERTARREEARSRLRDETGMTDEAIEGWALMLSRNPQQRRRLEAQYTAFNGVQTELARTAWRENDQDESGDSGADGPSSQAHRGGGGGRGRGRGRGGGRGGGGIGNVANAPGEKGTEQARRRKEANKSSRANHNRRDQRARKMARGGFPG